MPRVLPPGWVPSYRRHKASGQAVVTLGGRVVYLGAYASADSRAAYDRAIAEWLTAGRRPAPSALPIKEGCALTVAEMLAAFRAYAEREYTPVTVRSLGDAARWVRRLYGASAAREFGPQTLKAVREAMIRATRPKRNGKPGEVEPHFCRRTINSHMSRIRQIFKWAASQELIPAATWHVLQSVSGLRFGRGGAREKDPVRPVDDAVVEATLKYLTPAVADMVRLQRLTGMRPAEVCGITPGELDTSGDVWIYKPKKHKTAHHGKDRVVPIGPRAQAVLRAYLRTELNRPLFQPGESEADRHAEMRERRRTPLTPSQRERAARSARRKRSRPPGDFYTSASYRRAVARAAKRASVPEWSPNQLRHTRATELRRTFGIDTAGAVLGHSKLEA